MGVKYIEDINDEAMDKWITALRSGVYNQSRSELASSRGFCCLGVLGAAQGYTSDSDGQGLVSSSGRMYYWLPPGEVVEALNLPAKYVSHNGVNAGSYIMVDSLESEVDFEHAEARISVTYLNDHLRLDFNGIADRLEATFLRK